MDIDVLLGQAHDLTISSLVLALLALSVFATLSSGVFSVSTISLAALAGYTSGVLLGRGLPTEIMVPLGAIEGGVAALLLSYPLLRLASHRLALATIALLLVTRVIALNLTVTGGAQGIPVYRTLGDLTLFICVALTVWFFFRMRRSRFGLAIETVRADTSVAAAVGLNPTGVRRVAFVQSGVLAGVAGVLYASFVQYLSPDTYSTDLTFIVLAAVVLGGRFYWLGSIAGAFVFTILPFVLMNFISQGYAIANGIALIVIIILLPGGLIESGRRQQRRAARRAALESKGAAAPEAPTTADIEEVERPVMRSSDGDGQQRQAANGHAVSSEIALEARDLSLRYGGLLALDGLSFAVPKHSVFGIVGPNGAGKSTFLNVVSGLQRADSGSVVVDGVAVTSYPAHARARLGVSRTFQEVRLLQGLTVLETVMVGEHIQRTSHLWEAMLMLPSERRDRRMAEERAHALIERVGVIGRPNQYVGELSYANQRRVEIARALAAKPKILLLDEPTAGMHRLGAAAIGDLLLDLRAEGLTVVLIEHNLGLVLDYCERVAVMNFGQLLAEGPPAECLNKPHVVEAYFGRRSDAERIESIIELRKH